MLRYRATTNHQSGCNALHHENCTGNMITTAPKNITPVDILMVLELSLTPQSKISHWCSNGLSSHDIVEIIFICITSITQPSMSCKL